jgi:hypothetical protein
MELFPYQRADVDLFRKNNYTALVNIEPGGGKTVEGVYAIKESGASVSLIIAPDQTHSSAWKPTVEKVLGDTARVIGNTGKDRKAALADFQMGFSGIYLASPQFLTRAEVSNWSGDLLIADEGHLLNAAKAKGQRKLSGYSHSDGIPLAQRFEGRLFLSGTSWRNNFERAWATMRFLWPHLNQRGQVAHDNYYLWQSDRMTFEDVYTSQRDQWGNAKVVKKYLNESVPGRLLSEMPAVVTHFRRERCCDFHPHGFLSTEAPQEIREVIELAPAQRKAIRELEDHYMTWIDDNPLATDLTLTQQQRIRQIALGVPSLDFYVEEGEEKVTVNFSEDCTSPFADRLMLLLANLEDEPVVVYLESQRFASVLVKKLSSQGISAFEYSGKTKATRDDMLSGFGTKYRVAVVVIAAGGTGLDGLQKVTKTEVWLERSVDETNNVQAEARADRLGGRGQVQRWIFVDDEGRAEGRMNEQISKRLALRKTLRKVA